MMDSLFQNVDCVSFCVEDLDEGIAFYSALGLNLLWRAGHSCGLGMSGDVTEVVLTTERNPVVQFKVESVAEALPAYEKAGGRVELGPFDIDIGKCAVVSDRWGNEYCLLDMTKGKYTTDAQGNVTGVALEQENLKAEEDR